MRWSALFNGPTRAVAFLRVRHPTRIRLMPGQIVALVGSLVILLGTVLLMLPFATPPGVQFRFIDALFTATSAVCVTGLIVMDTPTDFSLFGELVILMLIQIGGLGYAMLATLLLLALGQRIGLRERMMLAEAVSAIDMQGLVRFARTIVFLTIGFELVGTAILAARFAFDMHPVTALYYGLFHAISAFNNAGFALFPDSLISYRGDLVVNLVVTMLILSGGIGFIVFRDVIEYYQGVHPRIHTHTRLVLVTSGGLLLAGIVGISALEWNNPKTLQPMSWEEGALAVYFQSVTARTAGFNTLDVSQADDSTQYLLILLMLIGGSPGSMAGGIKTTVFAVVCLAVLAAVKGRADVQAFYRRIPMDLVIRAVAIFFLAVGVVTGVTLLLCYTETLPFLRIMFEVASAFGTVGLSTGDGGARSYTALFGDFGKVTIILTMLIGRFGPLTIGLFAIRTPRQMLYRFPQSKVIIG